MQSFLLVLLLLATLQSQAQSLADEDLLLRTQLERGEIRLDQYQSRAEKLRDLVAEAGGYPDFPLDSAGVYQRVAVLENNGSAEGNWKSVRRWLALGDFGEASDLEYIDEVEGRIIVRLRSPFILKDGRRQLIPIAAGWMAEPPTVTCVVDLEIEAGKVSARWLRPVLTEHQLVTHTIGEEEAAPRMLLWPTEYLLPLVRYSEKSWEIRLHRARVVNGFVEGLAADLERHLTTADQP